MAGNTYAKNIKRTIFGSMGRYIAILAIIALGVGFFAGVKNTRGSMMETCNKYVSDYNMYDYRLLSTYGFTEEDEAAFAKVDDVAAAEGSITQDFFSLDGKGNSIVLSAHSLTEDLNNLSVSAGRLPKADDECVVDEHFFGKSVIGDTIKVTNENDKETREAFDRKTYKIVGIVQSTYYIMKTERGTSSLGDGRVDAFIYLPRGSFTSEYFTEMFMTCRNQGFVFSEEYENNIKAAEADIEAAADERGNIRLADIKADAQKEIDKAQQELDDGRAEFEKEKANAYTQLKRGKAELDQKDSELNAGKESLALQKADLDSQKTRVEAGLQQANANLAAAIAAGADQAVIDQIQASIDSLKTNLQKINTGLDTIAGKEAELAVGVTQLKSGYNEYYSNKQKADSKFAAAEQKLESGEKELADAEKKLADTEAPELYIQTREDNISYDSFESNSAIVDGVAKVFPVFFFLIAALVCSTTMSRMIEEERTQIGALRALGYTTGRIMRKYMIYSGSAAIIGCVGGFLAGSKYFPYAIWIAYGMMFGFAPLEFYMSWRLAAISLIVAVICSAGTTYFACRGQLRNTPAEILRPRTPKAGKRIILERIGILWNHLSFLHKVTARNVFRYKKRMLMMMLGIGGCTALVLTGFGINDSIAGIADHQYSEIEKYQMAVGFTRELDDEELTKFKGEYGNEIKNTAVLQQTSVNAGNGDINKTCSLMISDDDNINKAISFKTMDDKSIKYPGKGKAVINNKLASMLKVEAGDKIEVEYDDTKTVKLTVSGVYKNYVSNYIYINKATYEEIFDKQYEPTAAFITFKDKVSVYDMSTEINKFDDVAAISINQDTRNRVDDMMKSLDYIITLVIGCAGALAFIVLFNLGNINITEREREIATIKVLGFYPRETGSYVFRENLVLVLLGIAVGLPAGMALHKFVMSQIVVDAVSFNEIIEPKSFVFAVIVVLGFTFIVDIILRRKLHRINMAEALKSIE